MANQITAFAWSVAASVGTSTNTVNFRIYVYPLPDCSFDHVDPEEIDGSRGKRWHAGRPPSLPIHRKLVAGKYTTTDPHNATFFYIPAPFAFWDNSADPTRNDDQCAQAVHRAADDEVIRLGSEPHDTNVSRPALIASTKWGLGASARSVSMWIRVTSQLDNCHWTGPILSVSASKINEGFFFGFHDGCPAVTACPAGVDGCAQVHRPECNRTAFLDGHWHFLTAIFDGRQSHIIADTGSLGNPQPLSLNTTEGPVHYGTKNGAIYCANRKTIEPSDVPSCEVHGLQLYDKALSPASVGLCKKSRVDLSPYSRCFQLIQKYVDAQPWIHRYEGFDHVVLLGGADYPAAFNPNGPPLETDFVFEAVWPTFRNFVILHFGSRAERQLARLADESVAAQERASTDRWLHRAFQTVTIPPLFDDERFDPKEMADRAKAHRNVRVAYRGLVYSAMVERIAIKSAMSEATLNDFQHHGVFRVEFTNWTHEMVQAGVCKPSFAFEGLCPWAAVGRGFNQQISFGKSRVSGMKKRSLQLWADSETCLVLPGDGGYELRLYSMMNLGCVPVIIHSPGISLPKIPFTTQLPWHKFAIFWSLTFEHVRPESYNRFMWLSSHQLLCQLAALDPAVIAKKRAALLRYAPSLGWHDHRGGGWGLGRRTALDLLAGELAYRAHFLSSVSKAAAFHNAWRWKVPNPLVELSAREDVTGNSCPLGWPICEGHSESNHGDVCRSVTSDIKYSCPVGCFKFEGPPFCVHKGSEPCRSSLCWKTPHVLQYRLMLAYGQIHSPRAPRLAILTFSNRQDITALTRPSLERFCAAHPERYELIVEEELLLDPRDYGLAWNKLAFARRALVIGGYDAVVWVGDGILITEPLQDPLFEALRRSLLRLDVEKLVLASRDERVDKRVPLSTGILALKHGRRTIQLIDDLFNIAKTPRLLDGRWHDLRKGGWWDQDAFGIYIAQHGDADFEIVDHGILQSIVRVETSQWRLGHFAAHFTGNLAKSTGQIMQVRRVERFLREELGSNRIAAPQ